METEQFVSILNGLDFEGVVRQESLEYLTNWYKSVSYQDRDDDKKFINNGLKRFINRGDKMIFLIESINHLNGEKLELEGRLDNKVIESFSWDSDNTMAARENYEYHSGLLNRSKRCEARIFYAVRELEKLGLSELSKNAFSDTNVEDLNRKLNALLIKIDELTIGQEIIYDFIDELKTDLKELGKDFPLGKKRWYQRATGIIVSYAGKKGADVLFEQLKPALMTLIKQSPELIEKLLN